MGARTLYGYYRSSAAYRMRIALNLKGLDREDVFVHLRKGEQFDAEYVKLNPQQQVPTLVEPDGDVLIQSPAMLEYLEEVYPTPALLPSDPIGRARVRAISMAIGCDVHPVNNLRILKYLRERLNQSEDEIKSWIYNWIELGLNGVEAVLADGRSGTYCHGDAPTLADIYLAPQVYNAERFDYPMERHPEIVRVYQNARKLDAFADAYPDAQPDAE